MCNIEFSPPQAGKTQYFFDYMKINHQKVN
jgi:hypothetical protein